MGTYSDTIRTLAFHEMLNAYSRYKDMKELYEVGMVDQELVDTYEEYELSQELEYLNKLFADGTL